VAETTLAVATGPAVVRGRVVVATDPAVAMALVVVATDPAVAMALVVVATDPITTYQALVAASGSIAPNIARARNTATPVRVRNTAASVALPLQQVIIADVTISAEADVTASVGPIVPEAPEAWTAP